MDSTRWTTATLIASTALAAWGCAAPEVSSSQASGTVALSADDAFVYAVDTDNAAVAVVDAASLNVVTLVPVGKAPERITLGRDGTLYVANRGERSVSVLPPGNSDPASWRESARIPVGVEPVGLVVSGDGSTLYVVNRTSLQTPTYGTLMAFDTGSLQMKWEIPVGEEPHGIALVDRDKALITLFKQGDVVLVDLSKPEIVQSRTTLYDQANAPPPPPKPGQCGLFSNCVVEGAPALPGIAQTPGNFRPHGMTEVLPDPTNGHVYALTSWESEAVLQDPAANTSTNGTNIPPPGGGAAYGSFGCNGSGAVVSGGLVTFKDQGRTPVVNSLQDCGSKTDGIPPTQLISGLQGPSALAIDRSGTWAFVVNRNSNNVAVISVKGTGGDNSGPGIETVITVGEGPSGIGLSSDGRRAYVYNSFSHDLSVLEAGGGGALAQVKRVTVAADVLPALVVQGRKLFFSATDGQMTSASVQIACASCHLEGREDGHVWNFSTGPRRTPSLAGRRITLTPPFHWSGEFATLSDFLDHTIGQRMGGTAVTSSTQVGQSNPVADQIAAFIDSLELPDNPMHLATPTDAQVRGRQVFEIASCTTCHGGSAPTTTGSVELFTNNNFANVGTFVDTGDNPDDPTVQAKGLNVPSLLGLARAAPYLHDGSAATFYDRIRNGQATDLHGMTANLTNQQISDLVAYLQSL